MWPHSFVLFEGNSSACTNVAMGFDLSRAELLGASSPRRAGDKQQGSTATLLDQQWQSRTPNVAQSHSHVPEHRELSPRGTGSPYPGQARSRNQPWKADLFPQSPHSCCPQRFLKVHQKTA